jgi:hypothetical protein
MPSTNNRMLSVNKKIDGKVVERHKFVHMQHETPHFLHASESILNNNMKCNPFPTMGVVKKVGPH